jgi:hypothetical protein
MVAVSVLLPVVVGGAAFLLVAKAVAASWTWGSAAFVAFAVVYAIALFLVRRWAMRQPDQAQVFTSAWGRAIAFGSGGRSPHASGISRRIPELREPGRTGSVIGLVASSAM